MFLRWLTLDRYGAFTRRTVDFGPGTLSLVIGANEAGKSTTLEALSDILWGIPTRSGQTFLYGRPALTLQAGIDLPGGHRLDVVRRGRGLSRLDTDTDVDPVWQTERDSRARWLESFGLSHAQLREGGRVLCQGGGDLAELVFTARSGRAVRQLLTDIQQRADSLYKEHGGSKNVAVRQALAEYEAARDQVAAATASAQQVREAREATEQVALEAQRAEREVQVARAALDEAQQRQRAAPHARRLAEVWARMAQLRGLGAVLDDEQLDRYDELRQRLTGADETLARLGGDLEQVTAERSGIVVENAVLADSDAIRRLHLQAEARLADGTRGERLSEEVAALDRQAAVLLRDLVGNIDERPVVELLASLRVPVDRATQLDGVARELEQAEQRLAAREEELRTATRRLADADVQGLELDPDVVSNVREAHDAIAASGSAASAQRAAIEARAEATRRRAEALRLAGLPTGATVPDTVPTRADIDEVAEEISATRAAAKDAERQVERTRTAMWATGEQLGRERTVELPDPADLPAARHRRDSLLAEVIDVVVRGGPLSPSDDLPGRIQGAVAHADSIADLLLTHADAAAREAELRKTLAEQEAGHEAAVGDLVTATERVREVERRWGALWLALGDAIPAPSAAVEVRRHLEAARAVDEEATAAASRIADLREQVDAQRTALAGALARAGRPRPDADLDTLLEAARTLLDEADASREKRATLDQLTRLEREQRRQRDEAEADHDAVVGRWRGQLRAVGIADDIDVPAWQHRRSVLDQAQTLRHQADERREQAENADRRHRGFVDEVRAVAERHDLPGADPAAALRTLSGRLDDATTAQSRSEDLDRRIVDLRATIDRHQADRTEALAGLEEQRQRAAVPDLEELAGAADRSRAVQDLDAEARRLTDLIRAAAPDLTPDALVAEHAHTEPDVLEADRATAAEDLRVAEEELKAALTQQAEARARARDLESGGGAAELHARAQERLAVVAERVERYLIARIQSQVLRAELEAYERQHASPLLDDAGAILQRLTGGRYVALGVEGGASGRALAIIGADEERYAPAELSEGTADQVFLALRLAGIASLQQERQANGAPTLPVVLDDVLMTFDDERAEAALGVMAELSQRWQIVVFSHHAHLAELAESLALDGLTVSHLEPPVAMDAQRTAEEIRRRARPSQPASADVPAPRPSPPVGQPTLATTAERKSANPGAIREWARAAGYEVGDRGRIPGDVVAAYEQAHR
jgi:uncharacterized protein YhaN